MSAEFWLSAALFGGLLFLYRRPTDMYTGLNRVARKIKKDSVFNHMIHPGLVHEAMGPQIAGRNANMINYTMGPVTKAMQRPYVGMIQPNQPVRQVIEEVQQAAAMSYAGVRRKTQAFFNQFGRKIPQRRALTRYQLVNILDR